MPRDRRRSRRKRLLGPFGIGVAAFVGIAAIVAGNGASPRTTVGAVAGETQQAPVATSLEAAAGGPASSASARPPRLVASPTTVVPAQPESTGALAADDLTGYRWPLAKARVTLPFGPTAWGGWVVDGAKFHDGIDLATFCGDRIVAAHSGVIVAAGRHFDDEMGWIGDLSRYYERLDVKKLWTTLPIVVVIDDGNGYRSVYAHFGRIVVTRGQTVDAGDLLGYEGRTGRASGCHLHYGLFDPLGTGQFAIDPVAEKHMRLPAAEVARIDPMLVLPERKATTRKPIPSPTPAE